MKTPIITFTLLAFAALCSPVSSKSRASRRGYVLSSRASWYNLPGGARGMQCAARHYSCGSILEVWNARDSKAKHWRVVVTDYGPFIAGREIDLSAYAFRRVFGSTRKGVCQVGIKVIYSAPKCRTHRH